jgi:hypothetical protein
MPQSLRRSAAYDRFQVRDILGVTIGQFQQLRRSPIFPKPIYENDERGDEYMVLWAPEDIERFKQKMDAVAAKGWVMPIALYRWPGW